MNENTHLRLTKWPFYTGDALLVFLAILIVIFSDKPLGSTAISWCVISITFGALLFIAPFVLEYLNALRVAKNQLQETVEAQHQSLTAVLHELNNYSKTLSDLAQKSANSSEKIDNLGPELQSLLNETGLKLKELIDDAQSASSRIKSQGDDFNQRMESLENSVKEVSTYLTAQIVNDDENEKAARGQKKGPKTKNPTSKQDPSITNPEEETEVITVDTAAADEADSIFSESVEPESNGERLNQSSDAEDESAKIKGVTISSAEDTESIALIAHLNISIDSTPYVRGEGAGLKWDEGIPMDFIEIGKWEWVVNNANETASCRIFKDDTIAARGDDIIINIGERAEVYPEFPEE